MIQRFSGDNNQITALRLMDQVIGNAGIVPQAFLCTRHYRIYCVHNLSRYTPAIDGTVTPWDDGIFGFVGEIVAGSCASIHLPPEVFAPLHIRAYTAPYMQEHIDEVNDNPGLFDIPPPGHAEASVLSTRGLMVLPSRYVALLL
jgi:hypothetical protein